MSYPMNVECVYRLVASPGNAYLIDVNYRIQDTPDCTDDYLEVRENDGAGKFVAALCGEGRREAVVSNTTWIKFKTDNQTVARGFTMLYEYGKRK